MTTPRLEIDLNKIYHNTKTVVKRLSSVGISVTGISKAILGSPQVVHTMLLAGAKSIGDSRIENIEVMRKAKIKTKIVLTRSPMLSQAARIILNADTSLNTEVDIISELSREAKKIGCTHGVIIMVELGDLREGVMPANLESVIRKTLSFPNIILEGIGTNLACLSGVVPDVENMAELSSLADAIEATFNLKLAIVSGGNSANIKWALSGAGTGRINNLRLGESIILGCEPLNREPINGLYTDAFTLFAEVIESGIKPTMPTGSSAQCAFGKVSKNNIFGHTSQAILAIGLQDVDICGLFPPKGIKILASSSDHLVVDSGKNHLLIGSEIAFKLNYSALLRAMTSPFVFQELI